MKKGAAWLLCLLVLVSLALPVRAEGQTLLYPGVCIQGDSVYLLGVATDGGTVQATANGKTVSCTALPLQETQLGVTYYCVASVTSSLSNAQKEQQRAGLIALSEALGSKDSMVLITMGREVSIGEPLTDSAARAEAIEQLEYTTYGTNLYDAIDAVLTAASETEGFRSVVFFSDGCDNSDVVKYTQEQVGRLVQSSGLSVSFLALLTTPVTAYASSQVEKLELYASLSLGGVYHAPLVEDSANYINAMENAAREIVNQSGDWTVFRFDAAELPRTGKTVELSVTWTGNGTSVTGTAEVDTASLPELPETEPETEPETVPETTVPPQTEAETVADVPEYVPDNDSKTLYYAAIGCGAAAVLVVIILIIVSARRAAKRRRKRAKRAAIAAVPTTQANRFVPVMPEETVPEPQAPVEPEPVKEEITAAEPVKEEPIPEQPAAESEEALPPLPDMPAPQSEEASVPVEEPEAPSEEPEIPMEEAEIPVEETEIPAQEAEIPVEETESPVEEAEIPAQPEASSAEIPTEEAPQEAPVPEAMEEPPQEEPHGETSLLDALNELLSSPAPEDVEPPVQEAEKEKLPVEDSAPLQPASEDFTLDELYQFLGSPAQSAEPPMTEPVKEEIPPENAEEQEEADLSELYQFLSEPIPVQQEPAETNVPLAEPWETNVPAEPEPQKPAKQRRTIFRRQERWIDDVTGREDEAPIAIEPEPKAPSTAPSCTVQLIPEGNPGGSVYVVMEPNSSRTLGRNQKADIILSKSDRCLSGLHFELQWDGRQLYLTDRNSTNGTAITGVRQKPGHWARVASGSTIQAGNIRYKVRIKKN